MAEDFHGSADLLFVSRLRCEHDRKVAQGVIRRIFPQQEEIQELVDVEHAARLLRVSCGLEGVPGQPQKRTGGLEGSSLCTGLKRTKHLGKDSLQTAILRLGSS